MNSIEMQRIYFDNIFSQVTFGHNETDTSLLQPGRYKACRLLHIKNKGVRQWPASSRNLEAIDA